MSFIFWDKVFFVEKECGLVLMIDVVVLLEELCVNIKVVWEGKGEIW